MTLMHKQVARENVVKLKSFAAYWGADYDLVQGQGGNISYKRDGILYVKGSGTRLRDADSQDILVACDLDKCNEALLNDDEAGIKASTIAEYSSSGFNPSIETSLHAVLPKAFVFHYHCVNAIATTVCGVSSNVQLALDSYGAVTIDYRKPGLSLSYAILEKGVHAPAYVLQNHGVVVQADSLSELEQIIMDMSGILKIVPSAETRSTPRKLQANGAGWSSFIDPEFLAFGKTVIDNVEMRRETWYPDHAVILGPGIPASAHPDTGWYVCGRGLVHILEERRPALEPMIEALIRVGLRLNTDCERRALSSEQVTEVLSWDAEKDRQTLLHNGFQTQDGPK